MWQGKTNLQVHNEQDNKVGKEINCCPKDVQYKIQLTQNTYNENYRLQWKTNTPTIRIYTKSGEQTVFIEHNH